MEWSHTYEHRGKGSTEDRRRDMRNIYQAAAPIPGVELTPQSSAFLNDVRDLVFDAIENGGGKLVTRRAG